MLRSNLSKLTIFLLLLVLLALNGCLRNFNAFKELGVSQKNIPKYEINSEILDKSPPENIWATVKGKNLSEEQAKQIQADYIDKKLKDNKNLKTINIIVNISKVQYAAIYVKDKEVLKTYPILNKPDKFPAIVYENNTNK